MIWITEYYYVSPAQPIEKKNYTFNKFNKTLFNIETRTDYFNDINSPAPAPFKTSLDFQLIWGTVFPTINEIINLDIIDIGARARYTPDQDRQYKAIIEIADNPDYTNSTQYITNPVDGGIKAVYDHPLTVANTYYVKIHLEDTEGIVTSSYEYTFDAEEILYFLENPGVETQAPQANEITVRSPTASHTATTDPAPTADEKIQKIVEIDEGSQLVCQAVAEELIKRWGKEQITVSGPVDLTVTTQFKRELRTVVNEANIDDTLILQKKNHDVTGGVTELTLGDINLDESELLARILDDMGA